MSCVVAPVLPKSRTQVPEPPRTLALLGYPATALHRSGVVPSCPYKSRTQVPEPPRKLALYSLASALPFFIRSARDITRAPLRPNP